MQFAQEAISRPKRYGSPTNGGGLNTGQIWGQYGQAGGHGPRDNGAGAGTGQGTGAGRKQGGGLMHLQQTLH